MNRISRRFAFLLLPWAAAMAQNPDPLGSLANYRIGVSKRASIWDRSGGNGDAIRIAPSETAVLADIAGAGAIQHIWLTGIAPPNEKFRRYPLREMVLRMYWDGETEPSVESPLGDFFGIGFARYKNWQSLAMSPMPFSKGARITLSNEGSQPAYPYFHVDDEQYPDRGKTARQARFHAQWRQESPTTAVPPEISKNINKSSAENYTFVDAVGRGHFAGLILFVQGLSTGWWGEGDDMFFVDGEPFPPSVHGTGLEDYFNNAFGFQREFNYPYSGLSLMGNADGTGTFTMYRFHLQDPISFSKSLWGGIEHGHANVRRDIYASVAFWYQSEPHKKFAPLPDVKQRRPNRSWNVDLLERDPPN